VAPPVFVRVSRGCLNVLPRRFVTTPHPASWGTLSLRSADPRGVGDLVPTAGVVGAGSFFSTVRCPFSVGVVILDFMQVFSDVPPQPPFSKYPLQIFPSPPVVVFLSYLY